MAMGAVRHISDLKTDQMSQDSSGVIGLQSGSNKGASQAGMTAMGAHRMCNDIPGSELSAEGANIIGLQMGSNKGANQSGMSMGATRSTYDPKASYAVINLEPAN